MPYGALNRLTNMVDGVGTTKYRYTAAGLLWTEDGPFANDTVTNTYLNRLRVGLSASPREIRAQRWRRKLARRTGSCSACEAPNPVNALQYDANCNLTNSRNGDLSCFYDDENRLIRMEYVTEPAGPGFGAPEPVYGVGWRVDFEYDGLGRLRRRTDYHTIEEDEFWVWDPTNRVAYIYDGWRVIQERDAFTTTTPQVSYTRGNDLSGSLEGAGGIGGLLARTAHSGINGTNLTHAFYHADGNGNVTYLLNSSQSKVAEYRYDPFGNTISQSGSLAGANVYRFSSKEVHVNSGLYYYGYRFYDPFLQRWVNQDPILEGGGINLYTFVENNPINEYDIDGRILGRRTRSSCGFWDNRRRDPNLCTRTYATAAAVVCRIARESPWEQCQRWCLQVTYTTFGQNCCTPASAARFAALTAARYAACPAACYADVNGLPLPRPPLPALPPIPIPGLQAAPEAD